MGPMNALNKINYEPAQASSYSSTLNVPSSKPRKKLDRFPIILHRILSDEELSEIITWLPHGCSWMIKNKSKFVNEVIPKFFNHKSSKSFLRQVNGWGFIRITKGADEGSYYHKRFWRDEPSLVKSINRPPNFKATCNKDEDPPNFRLINEQRVNQRLIGLADFELRNQSQSIQRIDSNQIMNEVPGISNDFPRTSIVSIDDRASPSNHTSTHGNPSTRLYHLLEHRQKQIIKTLYLEELTRINRFILLRNSGIINFNHIYCPGNTML